ncbi:methyltransferase-like protein 13, partial [Tanacetum coccineum]
MRMRRDVMIEEWSGVLKPLFLVYLDDVVCSVVVDKLVGAFVGEFVVEDVEIGSKEFRRRLRFSRMPNLIQSHARLVASFGKGVCETCDRGLGLERMRELKGVEFRLDTSVLVHPYLTPMVCGLFLIVGSLNEQIQLDFCPRALCLGVGGGALLSFFSNELGFKVVGVEADEVVLSVARHYFRLNDGKSVQVIIGDAIEMIEKVACGVNVDGVDAKFDVIMVDLDSNEARSGISALPPKFVRKSVFQVMRSFLHDHGVLVINVISPNKVFYENLVRKLQDFFYKVYEMDVANDGNVVLMATLTPITWPPSLCVMHCSEIVFRDYVQKVKPGSHHHLFLPSDFPKRNWCKLKPLASLDGVLENYSVPCMEGKNSRIHNKGSQSIDKVVQLVNDEVRYKLLSLKFKPIKNSVEAAGRWQLG